MIILKNKCGVIVELVYSGHIETCLKHPDYQSVLILEVSLLVNGYFGTINKCPDYGAVLTYFRVS